MTYGTALQQSEPPQTDAELVVVHPGEGTTPHLLDAEVVYRDLTARFLANNGSLLVSVDRKTPVYTLYGDEETNARIRMGTRLVAWYDIVLTSYPGQTAPEKVVLLPDQDRSFTIITGGDLAIAEGRIENGVAMVPVRKVAEELGYTVTWNNEDESVLLELAMPRRPSSSAKTSIALATRGKACRSARRLTKWTASAGCRLRCLHCSATSSKL